MLGVLAHWTIYWNEWVIEWIELKWMIPPLKTGCPPRLELGSSLAVAQMAGQGSRKEDTQNEEESDFDTTQTLTHWVRGGGSLSELVSVSSSALLPFFFPEDSHSVTDAEVIPAVSPLRLTQLVSCVDLTIWYLMKPTGRQASMLWCVCVCVYWCVSWTSSVSCRQ